MPRESTVFASIQPTPITSLTSSTFMTTLVSVMVLMKASCIWKTMAAIRQQCDCTCMTISATFIQRLPSGLTEHTGPRCMTIPSAGTTAMDQPSPTLMCRRGWLLARTVRTSNPAVITDPRGANHCKWGAYFSNNVNHSASNERSAGMGEPGGTLVGGITQSYPV